MRVRFIDPVICASACALLVSCSGGGPGASHAADPIPAVTGTSAPGAKGGTRHPEAAKCSGTGSHSVVAGGDSNVAAGTNSGVFVGGSNEACNDYSAIVGGYNNLVSGATYSFIGAGVSNTVANSDSSFIGAGSSNTASGLVSFIGAGTSNAASANAAAIAGGYNNQNSGQQGFIGGGYSNTLTALDAVLGGGQGNQNTGDHATLGGGLSETVDVGAQYGFIGGGFENYVDAVATTIAGGYQNKVYNRYGVIAGGDGNTVNADFAFIGGGLNNDITGEGGYVAAGGYNFVSGTGAVIDGGFNNTAAGGYATVPGGYVNSAGGIYSFAAGARASAVQNGTFVWSDGSDGDTILTSTRAYQFLARASGGFTLWTNTASTVGATLAPGSGTWASASDRAMKTNIARVDDTAVLDKVANLPISRWSYITERGVRHVGPMAQDFYAAFGVGEDDKHITSIDEDGVALAAIKALHAENARLRVATSARIAAMQRRLLRLSARIDALERVSRL